MIWLCALWNWIRDPDNLTAISTFVVAIFTVVLALVAYVQARLLRKSIDLARAEFLSTHRAPQLPGDLACPMLAGHRLQSAGRSWSIWLFCFAFDHVDSEFRGCLSIDMPKPNMRTAGPLYFLALFDVEHGRQEGTF